LWVNQVHPNRELLEPRHTVKAGLTGWWQVNGRNDLSLEQTLKLDLFYIENWSLWFDVYILVKTVEAVLRRNGAY
jgi:lipopolysaccharide/colanic/teichoic acid biosynthesis glycosyltransferase